MAKHNVSIERQARAVVDSDYLGRKEAARVHGLGLRTLDRYVARSRDPVDPLHEATRVLRKASTDEWVGAAKKTLHQGVEKLSRMIEGIDAEKATARDVKDLAEALSTTGELILMREALFDEGLGEDPTDQASGSAGKGSSLH